MDAPSNIMMRGTLAGEEEEGGGGGGGRRRRRATTPSFLTPSPPKLVFPVG